MYQLRLEKRATKALKKISEPVKSRLINALEEMTRDPSLVTSKRCRANGKASIVGAWVILESFTA